MNCFKCQLCKGFNAIKRSIYCKMLGWVDEHDFRRGTTNLCGGVYLGVRNN